MSRLRTWRRTAAEIQTSNGYGGSGCQAPPAAAPSSLLVARPNGTIIKRWDLLCYELRNNPDRQPQFDPQTHEPLDALSNPFAVHVQPNRILVADAGANAVLAIDRRTNKISTFFVPPRVPVSQVPECAGANDTQGVQGCDPVPTGVTQDKHGNIYVSTLGGDRPNAGRVYVLSSTGKVLKVIRNLEPLTGIAVDSYGNVFVSELFAGDPAGPPEEIGQVVRITPNGNRLLRAGHAAHGPGVQRRQAVRLRLEPRLQRTRHRRGGADRARRLRDSLTDRHPDGVRRARPAGRRPCVQAGERPAGTAVPPTRPSSRHVTPALRTRPSRTKRRACARSIPWRCGTQTVTGRRGTHGRQQEGPGDEGLPEIPRQVRRVGPELDDDAIVGLRDVRLGDGAARQDGRHRRVVAEQLPRAAVGGSTRGPAGRGIRFTDALRGQRSARWRRPRFDTGATGVRRRTVSRSRGRRCKAQRAAVPPTVGSPAAAQAEKPPTTSVGPVRPRARSASAARLDV